MDPTKKPRMNSGNLMQYIILFLLCRIFYVICCIHVDDDIQCSSCGHVTKSPYLTKVDHDFCLLQDYIKEQEGLSWWYLSWIYNDLCNQCLSPLSLWVWTLLMRGVLDTTLCDKVCQWLATGQGFSPVSSTKKTDRQDITEILLKVALNNINQRTGNWSR